MHNSSDGTEVGAWISHNLLIDSGVVHQGRALLTLWGDDTMTEKVDGALANEPVKMTFYRPDMQEESPLPLIRVRDAVTQSPSTNILCYQNNGVWIAEIDAASIIPMEFGLIQNYPNPFNLHTTIKYQLPVGTRVMLGIYNLKGENIRTLVDAVKPAGYHEAIWNGQDDLDRRVSSGIYWAKMKAGDYSKSFKMSLIK